MHNSRFVIDFTKLYFIKKFVEKQSKILNGYENSTLKNS